MSKFCRNCGKELNEEQNVCLNCGVAVASATKTNNKADRNAMVGFILGLVSIVAWFIPLFGYPVCICGIIFSAKGLKSSTNKGKAITGLVLSIVFLVFTFINSMAGFFMGLETAYNDYSDYYYYY